MSLFFRILNPLTWFQPKSPTEDELRLARYNAKRAIKAAPKKRKAEEDLLEAGRKRLRLEQQGPDHTSIEAAIASSTGPGTNISNINQSTGWSRYNIFDWVNRNGFTAGAASASVVHASTVADFDCQAQLQRSAANGPDCKEDVVIQSNQSPHSKQNGVHPSQRTKEMPPPPRTFMRTPTAGSRRTSRPQRPGDEPSPPPIENANGGRGPDQNADVSSLLLDETSSMAAARREAANDQFSLEQARRHAAATKLPDNSGIWALSEKQLFYHLSLRGFEPLLPKNWMVDFKTLPLTLYADDNTDPPLIHALSGTDFRAIRALRSLIDTGKTLRDKSFAGPSFRAEKVIEKSVKEYFAWAFGDANFDLTHDTYVPSYHIMTRRKCQNTTDAMVVLDARLRDLATRHREHYNIASSIESNVNASLLDELKDEATAVYDDADPSEPPVLVGILIVSAILVIFTMNPYRVSSDSVVNGDIDNSGLRYIAKFDFSDAQYDVWNAIAVAVTAVHVREHMAAKEYAKKVQIKQEDSMFNGEMAAKPAAKAKGKAKSAAKGKGKQAVNAGWFNGKGFEASVVNIDDDDPDL